MTNYRSDLVDVMVEYLHHTDKAILIKDRNKEIWLPLSVVEVDGDLKQLRRGQAIEIALPQNWAKEKGLI